MNKTVKITSGVLRGRKIVTPGNGTHPMGERERLALFNMIASYLPGAVVLDAYAGSGALGIEALSRGAKEVIFVEKNRGAWRCITANLIALGYITGKKPGRLNADAGSGDLSQEASVYCDDVLKFTPIDNINLILADPPYDKFDAAAIERLIIFLNSDGVLVLSHPGDPPKLPGMVLNKSRKYAGATISIFVKK